MIVHYVVSGRSSRPPDHPYVLSSLLYEKTKGIDSVALWSRNQIVVDRRFRRCNMNNRVRFDPILQVCTTCMGD